MLVKFKFVICVVWPFINPNNDDDVEFKLFIDSSKLLIEVLILIIIVSQLII